MSLFRYGLDYVQMAIQRLIGFGKNEQQAGKLEKISKYMDTIQTEIDKFSKSEQALKQDVLKAKNTNFWLKILLVTVIVGMGLVFKIVNWEVSFMQKSDVFFKDFKISFIVAGLAFTVFFAMAIFFELAMGAIFKIEPSQARISLFVGFFMLVGVGFFLFSKNSLGNKVGGIVVTAILSAVFLCLKFYYF